jgi:endonuclease/exonuclease/phosphatase family metal-dependent hydrolase
MRKPAHLRIVTYNIHKGIGGIDRRYQIDRVIEVLRHSRADLVCLQEVDEGVPRSRGHRQVDVIGDALGLEHRAYFPNVRLKRGHYGNALLSRWHLDHAENIDLTVPMKKRRSALHARLSIPQGNDHRRMWLFNVHLGLAEIERRAQLRKLLAWQRHHRLNDETAAVIVGDFNDVWGRLGRAVLMPSGYRSTPLSIRTFPAYAPVRPLDRCYVVGPADLTRAYASRMDLARQASDHLPLIAIMRVV